MAGDPYDRLAAEYGFPKSALTDWRKAAGAPPAVVPAPAAPVPGFLVPQEYAPRSMGGMSRAPTIESTQPKGMPLATGSNVDVAPATTNPKVMRQIAQVAKNSADTEEEVKATLKAGDRKKNLEGATFADPSEVSGAPQGGGAASAAVLVDPGGRREASWQVSQGLNLGPEAEEAAHSADAFARSAANLDYDAGRKAAEFERGYLERHSQAAGKFAAEESARAQRYADQTDAHMQSLDELRAQIREAKTETLDNSPIARIGQAIAIAMGAFASKNGENHGLAAVNHALAMNQKESQAKLDKLDRGMKAENSFLGALKAQYGDVRLAKEAERIAMLEQAKVELAKNLGSPDVADPRLLAAYNRLQAKLDDELVNRTAHFRGITEDRVIRHDINAQPKYVGVGGATKEDRHDARWLAEHYETAGIPEALANLEGVDQAIDSFGDGDIPGVGPLARHVPDMLSSDRAVAGRQAVASIVNKIRNSIAGANVGPKEEENLSKQLDGAHDAASLRRVVQSVRRSLHHRQQNLAAGAGPRGEATYRQQGGSVKPVKLDKSTTPYIKPVE